MNGTYSAAELLTIIAAIGVLVTGVGAVIVNVIVALKTGAKIDLSIKKTEGLSHQVQEVHTLTNSNLSALKAELATALAQITSLHDVVQDLRGERQKAAVAVALATPVPRVLEDRRGSGSEAPTKVEVVNPPSAPIPVMDATTDDDRGPKTRR